MIMPHPMCVTERSTLHVDRKNNTGLINPDRRLTWGRRRACSLLRSLGLCISRKVVMNVHFHCMVTVSPGMADLSGHTACPGRI